MASLKKAYTTCEYYKLIVKLENYIKETRYFYLTT